MMQRRHFWFLGARSLDGDVSIWYSSQLTARRPFYGSGWEQSTPPILLRQSLCRLVRLWVGADDGAIDGAGDGTDDGTDEGASEVEPSGVSAPVELPGTTKSGGIMSSLKHMQGQPNDWQLATHSATKVTV